MLTREKKNYQFVKVYIIKICYCKNFSDAYFNNENEHDVRCKFSCITNLLQYKKLVSIVLRYVTVHDQ